MALTPLSLLLVGLRLFPYVLAQSTARFNFELSWGRWAPDGVERDMILVNGQFPGPILEVTEGDDVVVEVFNGLDEDSTIHFHGIEMIDTPWSDGVPGLSQRPIPPGQSFTYRWKALQYGSYWYHSHSNQQVEDGLYGVLTILPRASTLRPFNLISESDAAVEAMKRAESEAQPLIMAEYRHMSGHRAWELTQRARFDPACWDSILFNGKGRVRCMARGVAESLLRDEQREMLAEMDAVMTDKGCFPARLMATAWGSEGSPRMMPQSVLQGCRGTDAPLEVIEVTPEDGWVALHLIGAFHGISGLVSIDEHPMWVFASDGRYVRPQRVEAIPITSGERFSVLIRAETAGDFKIRLAATTDPQIIAGYAILRVQIPGEDETDSDGCAPFIDDGGSPLSDSVAPFIDDGGRPLSDSVAVFDPNRAKPFPESPIPQVADQTLIMHMGNAIPPNLWALNATPLAPSSIDNRTPLLLEPRESPDHIVDTQNGSWVDIVLITSTSPNPPHPIHKHGVRMYLLGMGYGDWTWGSVEEAAAERPDLFNLVDPPLKDSFTSLKVGLAGAADRAWLALRYHSNNPGAWLLHCHVLGHLAGGMQAVLLDGLDTWPVMPDEYRQLAEGGSGRRGGRRGGRCGGRRGALSSGDIV